MITSVNDSRNYRHLSLDNGLKVLIVQDLESEKSAASLCVNTGHFDDPDERQGLAHFLEHMLFLGSKQFPEAGGFSQFVSQHGGNSNAWTGTEHSCYYFDVLNPQFAEALAHFADLMTQPLILPEACEKERQAIDAEFKLKLKDDSRRIYQVHKETVNQAHPFAKFSVGNKDTLADNEHSIATELRDFFNQHYGAERCTLAVLSPLDVGQTEQLVRDCFSAKLGDKKLSKAKLSAPLYLPQHQSIKIAIKPHKHMQKLVVSFALPEVDSYYKDKTVGFIAHLIGYEGQGSLYAELKRRGWINSLSAGGGINGSNFKDFNVSINLTDKGCDYVDDILKHIFQYLSLLKTAQEQALIPLYNDKARLLEIAFDNQEKVRPLDWVNSLSVSMQHYPEQDVIVADYLMTGFNREHWHAVLSALTANNMRIVYIHPDVTTEHYANWYQTPYATMALSSEFITQLNQQVSSDCYCLPQENPYLKNPVKLLAVEHDAEHPQKRFDSKGIEFWFKQDVTFRVAKGHFYLALDSLLTVKDVKHMAMTRLFSDLFMDSVAEQFYPAELAGLNYQLASHQGGITLHTWGLSTNQQVFVSELLFALKSVRFTKSRFSEYKKQLARHWLNSYQNKAVSQLFAHLSATMLPWNPTPEQLASSLDEVTFDEFCHFHQALFNQVHCQALLHGNWQEKDADEFYQLVANFLSDSVPINDLSRPITVLSSASLNSVIAENQDHAMVSYFQAMSESNAEKLKLMFLNHLSSQEYFHDMRTEKQLGYLVGSGFAPFNTRAGLAFYIQSPHTKAEDLLKISNVFLSGYSEKIAAISANDWQQHKLALQLQLEEKEKNLRLRSQRYWVAIGNGDHDFLLQQNLLSALEKLSQAELVSYCEKLFGTGAPRLDVITANSEKKQQIKSADTKSL